jgi:hypothetical protein
VLVGSGVTVGIGVGWAVLRVGCVVAVLVGCGVLVGVLVVVRVSVCDGTGTLAGVVVSLAVFVRVLLSGVAHDTGVSRHGAECGAACARPWRETWAARDGGHHVAAFVRCA